MSGQPKKTVGVLGGMGPDATVDFMSTVIALTDASKDQEHVRMIVDHNPQVPDRQAALSGDRSCVSDVLVSMAVRLETAGADFLVMPCNTAYAFADPAVASVSIPFLNIIEETVAEIAADVTTVGVLATTACLEAGGYQAALAKGDRQILLPVKSEQERLMQLILLIKSGDRGSDVRRQMSAVAQSLVTQGAQAVIAGCTEIPIVVGQDDLDVPLFSSTQILARRTIEVATGQHCGDNH
jgi:aspartate racemase